MKTLLISLNSKYIHTNLAIRYLKNYIKDNQSIVIKDFTINQQIENITSEILMENPEVLAFSCYIWNIEYIKRIAYILKTANPKVKIIFGGPEVSYGIEKIMENNIFIDYIVFGEGEKTFNELYDFFNNKVEDITKIDGVAFRKGDDIIINNNRELIDNLDEIPSPFDNIGSNDKKMLYYESSRGCPFNCSFCMSSVEKKVRFFSLTRVKKDLDKLLQTDARQIKFVDRTFNVNQDRSIDIMKYIIENNKKNIRIHYEITAEIMNDKFLEFLKTVPVNMFQFEIGVQSLNMETLSEINRIMSLEKLEYVVKNIKSNNNIHQHLDLISGLPYEDYNSFIKSFNGVFNLEVEKIQLGSLKVLNGTKIYRDKLKHEIKHLNFAPYEVIKTKYINYEKILRLKKIEELLDKYYNEKYFIESIKYIIDNIFDTPFEFFEAFSLYWDQKGLYNVSHKRKKLYIILFDFIENKVGINEDFMCKLKYDFVFNNPNEELLKMFDKNSEEDYRKLKHYILKNVKHQKEIFGDLNKFPAKKNINTFRIVNINDIVYLFKYIDKDNIFNRCKVYNINYINEEYKNEQISK